ncbi:hypothetical protein AC249_AIPGENE5526 [Exaiptasia diaphana]|nr:hypothetical protein AC249_AIPGENE5526 [Exaiptasia diaphana]
MSVDVLFGNSYLTDAHVVSYTYYVCHFIPVNGCQPPCFFVLQQNIISTLPATADISNGKLNVVKSGVQAPLIVFHPGRRLMIWNDMQRVIKSADLNVTNVQTIVSLPGVIFGLAWLSSRPMPRIEVSNLDGSNRTTVVQGGGMKYLADLKLDVQAGRDAQQSYNNNKADKGGTVVELDNPAYDGGARS